jgi:hypothetical protein
MIIARLRIQADQDKFLMNVPFSNTKQAKEWCGNHINKDYCGNGIVEYISLTDYNTMKTEEYFTIKGEQ